MTWIAHKRIQTWWLMPCLQNRVLVGIHLQYLYWDWSFPPTSGHLSFWTRIRMMLMNRIKLNCRTHKGREQDFISFLFYTMTFSRLNITTESCSLDLTQEDLKTFCKTWTRLQDYCTHCNTWKRAVAALKEQFIQKNNNSATIYSFSSRSKPIWLSFFCVKKMPVLHCWPHWQKYICISYPQ